MHLTGIRILQVKTYCIHLRIRATKQTLSRQLWRFLMTTEADYWATFVLNYHLAFDMHCCSINKIWLFLFLCRSWLSTIYDSKLTLQNCKATSQFAGNWSKCTLKCRLYATCTLLGDGIDNSMLVLKWDPLSIAAMIILCGIAIISQT